MFVLSIAVGTVISALAVVALKRYARKRPAPAAATVEHAVGAEQVAA